MLLRIRMAGLNYLPILDGNNNEQYKVALNASQTKTMHCLFRLPDVNTSLGLISALFHASGFSLPLRFFGYAVFNCCTHLFLIYYFKSIWYVNWDCVYVRPFSATRQVVRIILPSGVTPP